MSIATRRPIIGPAPLTPEWHDIHRRRLSATGVRRIMADKAANTVYHEMRGDVAPFQGNADTEDGKDLESSVLKMYARRANVAVIGNVPLLIDPDCPNLCSTPDAFVRPLGPGELPHVRTFYESILTDMVRWLAEAKTTKSAEVAKQLGDENSDELLPGWIWQGQAQAACTGVEVVDFPVLLFGRIRIFKMARSEVLVAKCREVADDMVRRVRDGDEPEFNYESPADQNTVRALYGKVDDSKTADLSPKAVSAWMEYKRLGSDESEIKDRRKALQSLVLKEMGESAIGLNNGKPFLKRKIVRRDSYNVAATNYPQLTAIK